MSSELRQIDRRLRNIEETLAREDLINEKEACQFLGITSETMRVAITKKQILELADHIRMIEDERFQEVYHADILPF